MVKMGCINFFTVTALNGVEVVSGTDVSHVFSRHSHEKYCLGMVTRGERELNVGRRVFQVHAGGLFAINPGEAHSCRSVRGGTHDYAAAAIPGDYLSLAAPGVENYERSAPRFTSPAIRDNKAAARLTEFFSLIHTADSELQIETALTSLLRNLVIKYGDRTASPSLGAGRFNNISRVRDYLDAFYSEPVTLKQLAGVGRMSPFYLQRTFLEQFGLSPHDYLTQTRVKKASQMLKAGASPAETAASAGFVDQSHMTRVFKKSVGLTPGRYRQNFIGIKGRSPHR